MRGALLVPLLSVLFLALLASPAAADELIDYKSRSLSSGDTLELQQGYSVNLEWIKKDLDAVGVVVDDGSVRPFAEMIMEKNETRVLERGGSKVMTVTVLDVSQSEGGRFLARLEIEQYRDPGRQYPEPVLQQGNFRVGSGAARDLAQGYSVKVSSEEEGVRLTLIKNSIPLERYFIGVGDVVTYSRVVEGQEYTVLTGKVGSVFEDTQGNVNVVFSTINQYRAPEANNYLEGPAPIFVGIMGVVGVLIIVFSLVFRRES